MIALLPLRGWAGDAMATSMATADLRQPHVAIKTVASHAHESGASSHFHHQTTAQAGHGVHDCGGAPQASQDESSASTDGQCESCPNCQACHTVALSSTPATLKPVVVPLAPQHSLTAQFASADTALRQKPPIS